jgi:hypothetical protein
MIRKGDKVENKDNGLRIVEPYDFTLSLRAVKSFQPAEPKKIMLYESLSG